MPSTRELRRRIKSVRSTRQITKAMELVSASKMRRATEATLASRPYSERAWEIMNDLTGHKPDELHHPLLDRRPLKRLLAVVIGSDRGLAGAFNVNLLHKCHTYFKTLPDDVAVECITIGSKAAVGLAKLGFNITQSYPHTPYHPNTDDILPLSGYVAQEYVNKKYDKVVLVYTEYFSMIRQEVMIRQLLPLTPGVHQLKEVPHVDAEATPTLPHGDGERFFLYEPSVTVILDTLLPRFVEIYLYQALLESLASEHSSRRMAMKNATDNATGMLDDLTLTYNSLRQSAITAELAEITGGAAALQS
jgi:F-type H+-transporting ATPase subunit gamma